MNCVFQTKIFCEDEEKGKPNFHSTLVNQTDVRAKCKQQLASHVFEQESEKLAGKE